MFPERQLLGHAKFLQGSLWLIVQQLCVAASVAFLALAAEGIGQPAEAIRFLRAFVLCMISPYGFGTMANLRFEQWYLSSVLSFAKSAVEQHRFKPRHYPLEDVGAERETVFSNTAPAVLGEFCGYVMNLLSSTLNATLTLIAVALVVDWKIALSAAVSFAGCFVFGRMVGEASSRAAFDAEDARVRFAAQGSTLWPNLAVGNKSAAQGWTRELFDRFDLYSRSFNRSLRIQSWSQLGIVVTSLVPTAAVLIYVAVASVGSPTHLAAVLVVAPRVFQILLSLNDLSVAVYDWHQVKGRLDVLGDFFKEPDDDLPRVDETTLHALEITGPDARPIASLRQRMDRGGSGRICLSGPNGSGKSTLLLTFKQELGESAFYLPSQSRMTLGPEEAGSTGQRKRREIEFISALPDPPKFIFLDEWDANLDQQNLVELDRLIAGLSESSLVVEVRHRQVPAFRPPSSCAT